MEEITSRKNPLCAHFRKLASSRAYREETGEFLCDSPKLLKEAELWGATVCAVLFTKGGQLPPFADRGVRLVQVSESVMEAVSPMATPQGVVFSCRMGRCEPPARLEQGRYLLLEGCADLYHPKTVRSAIGVHFRRAVWRCGLEQAADLIKEAGLPLYGATLGERTVDVRRADLRRAAVMVGSEGRGLSQAALEACTAAIQIPMSPRCESLNAAVAAAVVLWEGIRGD